MFKNCFIFINIFIEHIDDYFVYICSDFLIKHSVNMSKKLTSKINNLQIRINDSDPKCCFDVLVNGLQLTSNLTLGELFEFISMVFISKNHSICYLDDFGKFKFE